MGAYHAEAYFCERLTAYAESIYRRIVLRHKKLASRPNISKGITGIETSVARLFKLCNNVSYCQKVDWRVIKKS